MRLKTEIINELKRLIEEKIPGSAIYLFGSRTDDQAKGGDIDIMILSEKPAEKQILRKIRVEFFKKFGWQKMDLINFTYKEDSAFRKIIEPNSIKL